MFLLAEREFEPDVNRENTDSVFLGGDSRSRDSDERELATSSYLNDHRNRISLLSILRTITIEGFTFTGLEDLDLPPACKLESF